MTLVTVSIPYFGCPGTIRRAVEAVLGQSVSDLRCVVVNDADPQISPWPLLADIADPRLVRLDLTTNHGRYFADALVLRDCDSKYFTVHDADDIAEPRWLATMLEAAESFGGRAPVDCVQTYQRIVSENGAHSKIEKLTPPDDVDTEKLHHYAHMAGLWRTEWLRAIGGPHPGFRIGYDSVLSAVARLAGLTLVIDEPLYNRQKRAGSLTSHPATGYRSHERWRVRAELDEIWRKAVAAWRAEPAPASIGEVARSVHAGAWRELADTRPVQVPAAASKLALARQRYGLDLVGNEAAAPRGGWVLPPDTLAELDARLAHVRPQHVAELGSGASTLLLARYAAATGARVTSLEHSPAWLERTAGLLEGFGLRQHVNLIEAPLRHTERGPMYETSALNAGAPVDFALIDGPPMAAGGRAATLPALLPYLRAGSWEAWLDDGHRAGEAAAVQAWAAELGVRGVLLPHGHGVWQLWPSGAEPPGGQPARVVDASDVAVTLLTGRRPALLRATLEALDRRAHGLLRTAYVIALNNGADPETAEVLAEWRSVVDLVIAPDEFWTIGRSISELSDRAKWPGLPFWLHLEDDWQCVTSESSWLDTARRTLQNDSQVAQVRLRHFGDRVLRWHMVTRRPIEWQTAGAGRIALDAHWTFNPSLIRASDIERVFPCENERDAQLRAHRAGLRQVYQLAPGAFHHIGENDSLRRRMGQ